MNNNIPTQAWLSNDAFASGPSGKSRGIFALLAIFLGTLGIQYFYAGKTTAGVITLLACLFTCAGGGLLSLLVLVQGILVFCMSNQEFEQKFCDPNKTFPIF